jgi:hypothetical protein
MYERDSVHKTFSKTRSQPFASWIQAANSFFPCNSHMINGS